MRVRITSTKGSDDLIKKYKDAFNWAAGWFMDVKYEDGKSIGMIMRFQDEGTKKGIPRTAFFRKAFYEYTQFIKKNKNFEKEFLKKSAVDIIRKAMNDASSSFHNKASTVKRKGFDKFLFHTGEAYEKVEARDK